MQIFEVIRDNTGFHQFKKFLVVITQRSLEASQILDVPIRRFFQSSDDAIIMLRKRLGFCVGKIGSGHQAHYAYARFHGVDLVLAPNELKPGFLLESLNTSVVTQRAG